VLGEDDADTKESVHSMTTGALPPTRFGRYLLWMLPLLFGLHIISSSPSSIVLLFYSLALNQNLRFFI
jgi:hypothetical protein